MTNKIELMQKKISEITAEELNELKIALGGPGLPFPMARLEPGTNGALQHTVGVLESFQDALTVYSFKDQERVIGDFFREMMTPSMMMMERDLLLRTSPQSENFIMAVFGDAASGKSHMFRKVARTVHPQGAIIVDCGGMNMRELFFRTVIDYGQGQKEQFEKRLADGKVQQSNIDMLNAEFPGAVVQKNGKSSIDWDVIGARKTENGKCIESPNEATARAKNVLDLIYMKEGISQQTNSFGIKTVPGEIFESFWSGRPLFLDEFNKSKPGTLDTFQTYLEFANGQKGNEEITIYNPMSTAGDSDSPKSITLRRSDRKVGYFVGISGNDTVDGSTTQDLSYSMETRLNIRRIGNPQLRDWTHRISQVWTGLPLVTLYNLRETDAKSKPDQFAQWLVDLRMLGLSEAEKKMVPPEEIHLLQNFDKTVQAINQVAEYYDTRLQLSDPRSKIYEKDTYKSCEEEVAGDRSKRIAVSFRKVIADFENARKIVPEVRAAQDATWGFSLQDYFKKAKSTTIGVSPSVLEKLGANLVRVIIEDIVNDTTDMPATQEALIGLCKMKGICEPGHQNAKASTKIKLLGDLLKFDDLEQYGGAEKLKAERSVLIAALKSRYPDIRATDDKIVTLPVLGAALKKMSEEVTDEKKIHIILENDKRQKTGEIDLPLRPFVVPSDQVDSIGTVPLINAIAMPLYIEQEVDQKDYELVDFRAALAGLALPSYAAKNMEHVWPVDLHHFLEMKNFQESYDILMGKSAMKIDMTILSVANSEKERDYLYLVQDKVIGKSLVVGPEQISDELRSALTQNNIGYVWNNDPATAPVTKTTTDKKTKKEKEETVELGQAATVINDFMSRSAKERTEKLDSPVENALSGVASLLRAFSAINDLPKEVWVESNDKNKTLVIGEGTTLGEALNRSVPNPSIYTSIVKKATRFKK